MLAGWYFRSMMIRFFLKRMMAGDFKALQLRTGNKFIDKATENPNGPAAQGYSSFKREV